MQNFNFKKKYGQNFLQDQKVIDNIVDSIDCNFDDLIIEIGPGSGALTSKLKKKGCYVLCYEVDTELKKFLDKLEDDKLKVIYYDFLNCNVLDDIKSIKFNNLYIIGNLPYYITTPIILKIINSKLKVKEMIFMVQNEVADRFSASVGSREYGSISVLLNYYFNISKLFVVNKNKFYPIPGVDSAVIKFSQKDFILDVDLTKFNKIVKDSFQFKRKNLRNNLKSYDLDKIESILKKYNLSLNDRAENLSYEIFVELANNC